MKTIKFVALAVLLISAGAFHSAQAQEHPTKKEHPGKTEHPAKTEHPSKSEHPAKAGDIMAIASSAGEFKTLVTAIQAAGLEDKFRSKGPFTVFAPTDEAFAKLPAGTLEDLFKPANKAKLAGLLANHVVPGKIMTADVKTMKAANISGQDLDIKVGHGTMIVNNARVVQADLAATNGVIHAIDTVIIPAPAGEHPTSEKPKDHPAH